ncbi:MAG TPA: hypothetical protein VIN56_08700 [Candidatus Dormibacteraeota bacterium]|jgi:hypothetical protein
MTPPARKRATTRRRSTTARRVSAAGTTSGATTRKRSTTRKTAATKTATARKRSTAAAGSATAKRRGRPPGSRNRRAAAISSNPADAMSKKISDLINENKTLKAQVKELEAGWKKIEKALGSNVTKARRTVRRGARTAGRKVAAAINAVT